MGIDVFYDFWKFFFNMGVFLCLEILICKGLFIIGLDDFVNFLWLIEFYFVDCKELRGVISVRFLMILRFFDVLGCNNLVLLLDFSIVMDFRMLDL